MMGVQEDVEYLPFICLPWILGEGYDLQSFQFQKTDGYQKLESTIAKFDEMFPPCVGKFHLRIVARYNEWMSSHRSADDHSYIGSRRHCVETLSVSLAFL
jgi:hypothetical protein